MLNFFLSILVWFIKIDFLHRGEFQLLFLLIQLACDCYFWNYIDCFSHNCKFNYFFSIVSSKISVFQFCKISSQLFVGDCSIPCDEHTMLNVETKSEWSHFDLRHRKTNYYNFDVKFNWGLKVSNIQVEKPIWVTPSPRSYRTNWLLTWE